MFGPGHWQDGATARRRSVRRPGVGLEIGPIQTDAVPLEVARRKISGVDRVVDLSRLHAEDLRRLASPHHITLSLHTT